MLSAPLEPLQNSQGRHPFEFDAEKKALAFVIVEPNEHLCAQTLGVVDELLARYYDLRLADGTQPTSKLQTMRLHGRALLPKANALMPDIFNIRFTAKRAKSSTHTWCST